MKLLDFNWTRCCREEMHEVDCVDKLGSISSRDAAVEKQESLRSWENCPNKRAGNGWKTEQQGQLNVEYCHQAHEKEKNNLQAEKRESDKGWLVARRNYGLVAQERKYSLLDEACECKFNSELNSSGQLSNLNTRFMRGSTLFVAESLMLLLLSRRRTTMTTTACAGKFALKNRLGRELALQSLAITARTRAQP